MGYHAAFKVSYCNMIPRQAKPTHDNGHAASAASGQERNALVATDIEGDNIRVVTMYLPDSGQWDEGGRRRRAVE